MTQCGVPVQESSLVPWSIWGAAFISAMSMVVALRIIRLNTLQDKADKYDALRHANPMFGKPENKDQERDIDMDEEDFGFDDESGDSDDEMDDWPNDVDWK